MTVPECRLLGSPGCFPESSIWQHYLELVVRFNLAADWRQNTFRNPKEQINSRSRRTSH